LIRVTVFAVLAEPTRSVPKAIPFGFTNATARGVGLTIGVAVDVDVGVSLGVAVAVGV